MGRPIKGRLWRNWRTLFCILLISLFSAACSEDTKDNSVGEEPGSQKTPNTPPAVQISSDYDSLSFSSEIILQGQVNDADGTVVSQQWQQIAGPNAGIVDANALSTVVTIPPFATDTATFVFQLTVFDNAGASSSAIKSITLPKQQLIINVSQDVSVNSGQPVSLTVSVDYPVSGVVPAISWEVQSPSNGASLLTDISGANTDTLQFTAPEVSQTTNFEFKVTVAVVAGNIKEPTQSGVVWVTVNPSGTAVNFPPVVNAGNDLVRTAGDTVVITGSATDQDGAIASYQWSQINNGAPTVQLTNASTREVQFTAPQVVSTVNIVLLLTVTDNLGAVGTDEITIQVNPVNSNQPPTVSADQNQVVNIGQQLTLSATASDPDGTIQNYIWSNETANGPALNLLNANSAAVSFTVPTVTQRTELLLRITVIDNDGASASDDVIVTVNVPPTVNAGVDQAVSAGTQVILTGNATDSDGSVAQYLWSEVSSAVQITAADSPSASFTAPLVSQTTTLILRLVVTDNDNATATDEVVVTVNPVSNPPPVATAGDDQAVCQGQQVTLNGSGQDTAPGSVVAFAWQQVITANEPIVQLTNVNETTVSFTAPAVTQFTPLTFELTVTDNGGATGTDQVVINVGCATLSGTISTAVGAMTDSDVNTDGSTPVANSPLPAYQHIPNPVTLGGYIHRDGVGPAGASNNNGNADAEDIYHVSMTPGQVVNLYLGEAYFNPGGTNATAPTIWFMLTNDYTSGGYIRYGYATGTSGEVLTLTAPVAAEAPADGRYLISIQVGDASAFSYVLTVGPATMQQSQGWSTQQDFVPNEVIVEFKEPAGINKQTVVPLAQRAASVGMQALGGAPGRSMLLGLGEGAVKTKALTALGIQNRVTGANDDLQAKIDTIRAASALKQRVDVKSVRLNYIRYPSAIPNDTIYNRQWHYPLINLPQAWDITTGSSNVTVAVIDTGILSNHPDFDPARLVDGYDFIRSNQNSADGEPGIDNNPEDTGSSFHGTHVAGTVAASSNNGVGVAGIAWQANVMPLRALGVNGGTDYDIEQAIRYAAQLSNDSNTVPSRKADVINLSLGGPTNTTTAPTAYRSARQAGVIIVAAAGNSGSNQLSAPAAYNGVVSVSAVTINKQLASYSNFGSTIDVAAPGGAYTDLNGDGFMDAVWSTMGSIAGGNLQYTYDYAAGTSMASPHMAGVAALMKSVYPGLTPDNFDSMLAAGDLTQDLGSSGRDNSYGYGLIDAQKAVAAAVAAAGGIPEPPAPAVLEVIPGSLNFGNQLTSLTINISNSGGGTLSIDGISEDSGGWLAVNPQTVDANGLGSYAVSVDRNSLTDGLYTATVTITSSAGSMDMPVSMQVFSISAESHAGLQVIELIDKNTLQTVQTLRVLPTSGQYNFSFTDVPAGVYNIHSGSDLDNDGTLCEVGESCGAYPTLDNTVSSDITVDGGSFNINGLDFEVGFTINLPAQ